MNNRYDLNRPRRKPNRLKGYNYRRAGAYFVTIVVQGRLCLFGDIVGEEMKLNDAGNMIRRTWDALPQRFPNIRIDTFIVMPNHIHGIIVINPPNHMRATTRVAPTAHGRDIVPVPSLGDMVGAYKSLTTLEYTRGVNAEMWTPFEGKLWQRNYYEHIVRNDESLTRIRRYILDNPAQWAFDQENPDVGASLVGARHTSDTTNP